MSLPTIYARREPTTDSTTLRLIKLENRGNSVEPTLRIAGKRHKDVQFYRDKECRKLAGRVPWHYDAAKGNPKTTMLDSVKYSVEWLEPVPDHLWPFFIMPYRQQENMVLILLEGQLKGLHPAYDADKGRTLLATDFAGAAVAWVKAEHGESSGCAAKELRRVEDGIREFKAEPM